jgi:hypothetical protein
MNNRKCVIALFLILLIFLAYVGSYVTLSRRGYNEADQCHFAGFYYFTQKIPTTGAGRIALAFVSIILSMFWIKRSDREEPPHEPLWRLSR